MGIAKNLLHTCGETIKRTIKARAFAGAYHKTFQLIYAGNKELRDRSYRMRRKVLCEEYGYECGLSSDKFIERDQYDDHARHFLLRHRISHECVGSLRVILPNDERPGESFPAQKFCDHPLLKFESRAARLCEISRFIMAPRFRNRAGDGKFLAAYSEQDVIQVQENGKTKKIRRQIPYAQAALLQGAFEAAMQAQILDCIWMVEPAHLSSLEKIGFPYRILGPQIKAHGGLQPLIFNIKHVLDNMLDVAPNCWTIISDNGRLQNMADILTQNQWQDDLVDQACRDLIYDQLVK